MMRLDKYLAARLGLTRSESRKAIAAGRVAVNGVPCKQADAKINEETAAVTLDGKPPEGRYEKYVYLMLNKPDGVVSASRDKHDTTVADLVADAYRVVMGADIGMVNGGGIRADIQAGEITYEDIINVHPYGNEMCLAEATGQEILDALELGAMNAPYEDGGFQHVSGLTYTIDLSVPSSVVLDEQGCFAGVTGPYRVTNVLVNGVPLDRNATYTVASHNYMIKEGGSGFTMFMDNPLLQDCTMLDNQLLIQYITENLGGRIGSEYADPYGSGRIQILEAEGAAAA